jgi:hypothetical protein
MRVGQHQGDAVHRGLYFATWGGFSGRDEEDQRNGTQQRSDVFAQIRSVLTGRPAKGRHSHFVSGKFPRAVFCQPTPRRREPMDVQAAPSGDP